MRQNRLVLCDVTLIRYKHLKKNYKELYNQKQTPKRKLLAIAGLALEGVSLIQSLTISLSSSKFDNVLIRYWLCHTFWHTSQAF